MNILINIFNFHLTLPVGYHFRWRYCKGNGRQSLQHHYYTERVPNITIGFDSVFDV